MTRPVQCPKCGIISHIDGIGAFAGTVTKTEDHSKTSQVELLTQCKACNKQFEVHFDDTGDTEEIYFDIAEIDIHINDYTKVFEMGGSSRSGFSPSNISIEYHALVRSGGPVDFIILSDTELKHFERDHTYKQVPKISKSNSISVDVSGSVPEGKYWFVIDNGADEKTTVSLEAKAYFDPDGLSGD